VEIYLQFVDEVRVKQDQFWFPFGLQDANEFAVDVDLTVSTESELTYFAAPEVFQKEIASQNEVHAWFKGSSKDASLSALNFYFCTPDLETPEVLVAQSEKYPG